MKSIKKYYKLQKMDHLIGVLMILFLLLLTSMTACDNDDYTKDSPFDNVVYLNVAEVNNVENFTFNNMLETAQKEFSAKLAYPTPEDINIDIAINPSLAETFNEKHNTNYNILDSKYYKLSTPQVSINEGETMSKSVLINFSSLTELEIDKRYLLPVSISGVSGGIETLNGAQTMWYIVTRSSAITIAASLNNNYFEIPGFEAGSPTSEIVNNLTQMTYEAIIRVNKFEGSISSIMGIEQYCLLRIGDSGFPREQLQFCSPGDIKIPKADKNKRLKAGEWYHIAVTYDTENRQSAIYIDGIEQSRMEDFGNGEAVNLGKQIKDKDFMFKIGHSYGEPDDYSRQLDGEICEVRIWNTVRTQEEIWENMYTIDPQTPGLKAYWKFNEGEGNTAKDYTGNGNDAIAHNNAIWPDGIEVPMKNRE